MWYVSALLIGFSLHAHAQQTGIPCVCTCTELGTREAIGESRFVVLNPPTSITPQPPATCEEYNSWASTGSLGVPCGTAANPNAGRLRQCFAVDVHGGSPLWDTEE